MPWSSWRDVPIGEQNYLSLLADVWEQTIGFQVALSSNDLLMIANAGVQSQHDLGEFIERTWGGGPDSRSDRFAGILNSMPWAIYGLDKDTYASMTETFSTEYKKITGQDISASALKDAFSNPRDTAGGLLTASQYAQQLMNDSNIQKQFGWVKYGLDFSQWTQQKLQLQGPMGRSINDSEAAVILQYDRPASGANLTAIGRAAGQQQSAPQGVSGVTGSVAR